MMKISVVYRSLPLMKNVVSVYLTEKKEIDIVKENSRRAIYFGIGPRKDMTRRKLISLSRRIIFVAKQNKIKKISLNFSDFLFPQLKKVTIDEIGALLAQNFLMADFEFTKFKSKPKEGWNNIEEIIIRQDAKDKLLGSGAIGKEINVSGRKIPLLEKGLSRGVLIGEEINKCRVLANTPGGDMTPTILAGEARNACRGTKVRVKILGKKEMQKLKMGAVLGVAKGSSEEPRFIVLEYFNGLKKEKPIVLVGKGVTFDTGGLNLKPSGGILDMHLDMSGGAAVLYTLVLASKLKLQKNIVGLIPAVENMPSGSSYRPGDILRSMSGKTIEVLDTDAEGRIILADGITYAKQYKPRLVIDVGTLTGAALVAVGQKASVIVTKDKKIENILQKLGEETGDYVWPLPLWEEYEEETKGNFADVANVPVSGSRYAGAINGGAFLYQFAKDINAPWAHIDMAPRMVSVNGDYLAKGAAGAPVRLLVKLIEEY